MVQLVQYTCKCLLHSHLVLGYVSTHPYLLTDPESAGASAAGARISPKRRRSSPVETDVIVDETIRPLMEPRPTSPTPGTSTYSPSTSRSPGGTYVSPTRETWSPIRTSPPRRSRSQADVFHSENGTEPAPPPARHTKRPHSAGVVPSRVIRRHPDSGYQANDDEVSEVKSSKHAGSPWSGLDRPASSGSSGSLTNGHRVPSDDSSPEATLRVAVAAQAPQGSREHDEETLCVLRLAFPPATTPTLGLPRAVSPPESEKQRYYGLVEAAISGEMVAPLSRDWKSSTHEFLDKALRQDFRETLEELDKVRPGVHSEISAAHQES